MRRQIFFFHMVTLILALLTLLTVSGGVLHLVFRAYQDQAVPAADSRSGLAMKGASRSVTDRSPPRVCSSRFCRSSAESDPMQ